MAQSDLIGMLVDAQITPWRSFRFSDLENRLIHASNNHFGTFVYTIDCGIVTMYANPGITALIETGITHEVYRRANLYRGFIESVVNSVLPGSGFQVVVQLQGRLDLVQEAIPEHRGDVGHAEADPHQQLPAVAEIADRQLAELSVGVRYRAGKKASDASVSAKRSSSSSAVHSASVISRSPT